jgi:dUTP pyrophosphatase
MNINIIKNNDDFYIYGVITSYIIDILNTNINNKEYIKYELNKDIEQLLKYEKNYIFTNDNLYSKVDTMENKIKKLDLQSLINMICKLYISEDNIYNEILKFLNLNEDFKKNYIIGFFDANGSVSNDITNVKCRYISKSENMCKFISNFSNIPYDKVNHNIIYKDSNCIEFLHNLYKDLDLENDLYLISNYQKYINFINWKFRVKDLSLDICKVFKDDENAIIPSKANITDVGYDLTIIKKVKNLTNNTILYDTGIKISLDFGYYAEIAPRSSLSKSGYILANSIGIIENTYTGNLFIALTKTDPNVPDLVFPFKCCQLIFKPQIFINLVESKIPLDSVTIRGSGGFGSTNK